MSFSTVTKLILINIFFLLPIVHKTASAKEPNNAEIEGVVLAEDSTPLPYVQIYIESLQQGDVSNDDGKFKISGLPAGRYDVTFRLQGYETRQFHGVKLASNQTLKLNITLKSSVIEMAKVSVTATRSLVDPYEVPQMISVIGLRELQHRNSQQVPELLREQAGVTVQKTNQGGGSAIIRGLKANKILLLVDGVRLNNATYRGGNTQYLNTIESTSLGQVETVHGPVSVLYGSDALGGVINVVTKNPAFSLEGPQLNGTLSGTVSSADNTQSGNFLLNFGLSRFAFQLNGAFHNYGDIRRGENGGSELMQRLQNDSRTSRILNKTQSPNGYDAYDISSKALFQISESQALTIAQQHNRQNEVPRYDVVEVLSDSIRVFDPQERDLGYIRYSNFSRNSLFDRLQATVSIHRQFERRVRQRFGRSEETRDQFGTITLGAQIQLNKCLGAHQLVYGAEFYNDFVSTKSERSDIKSNQIERSNPLFPDGSGFLSFGLFLQDDFAFSDRLYLSGGARFSFSKLRAPFLDDHYSDDSLGNVEQSWAALTGSMGARINLSEKINFVTNIAQGFRTANLDDVSKLGPGKGASFYDVPNAKVDPEKSLSIDGGFKINSGGVRGSLAAYYTRLTDLLVRRPAEFNGSSTFILDGDTLSVFHKENAGRAYITGVELAGELQITSNFSLLGNLSYTYGQDLSNREPLSGIPPLAGLSGLRWQQNGYWAELNLRFAAQQDRLSLEDQEDLRVPEGGTPGWFTVNMRLGAEISEHISVRFAATNLLDRNYREHFSGFNAPGRNFILSLQLKN